MHVFISYQLAGRLYVYFDTLNSVRRSIHSLFILNDLIVGLYAAINVIR